MSEVFYVGFGDNLNAKNLYYYCKKNKLPYPFVRAKCKVYIPDVKLAINKKNQKSKFGLLTLEESIGHIVPGVLFEVAPGSDLSIFSDEFSEIKVWEVFCGASYKALVNKYESNNLLDMQKAKLSKDRKKTFRQAIKWRDLEEFETCYESAMCNYLYPYLVKDIFISNEEVDLIASWNPNEYNSAPAWQLLDGEKCLEGRLFYSNALKIKHDLDALDKYGGEKRRFVSQVVTDDIPILAWCKF